MGLYIDSKPESCNGSSFKSIWISYKTEKRSCNRPVAFRLPHILDFISPIREVVKMSLKMSL